MFDARVSRTSPQATMVKQPKPHACRNPGTGPSIRVRLQYHLGPLLFTPQPERYAIITTVDQTGTSPSVSFLCVIDRCTRFKFFSLSNHGPFSR